MFNSPGAREWIPRAEGQESWPPAGRSWCQGRGAPKRNRLKRDRHWRSHPELATQDSKHPVAAGALPNPVTGGFGIRDPKRRVHNRTGVDHRTGVLPPPRGPIEGKRPITGEASAGWTET